jgi:molybdopterin-guanine dinucleotide biosynthesis protein
VKKIIDGINVLGIIGLSKNSGKTTTLNAILNLYPDEKIGLTSIGLDGEDLDQVNFLPKPKIYVKKGMVIATASECLVDANAQYNVLEHIKMPTALGDVLIVKIISDGYMIIAGPTTNKELNQVISSIKKYVDKIFIDGAFNRMTFANIKLIEGIILAAGAAENPNMDKTISKTKMIVDFFNLEKSHHLKSTPKASLIIHSSFGLNTFNDKKIETLKKVLTEINNDIDWIYIKGAVTSKYIDLFTHKTIKKFSLICDDPTKLLISQKEYSNILKLKINVSTIYTCPLLCVTINPFSPSGNHYNEKEFMDEMKKAVDVEVYNVMKMEEEHV